MAAAWFCNLTLCSYYFLYFGVPNNSVAPHIGTEILAVFVSFCVVYRIGQCVGSSNGQPLSVGHDCKRVQASLKPPCYPLCVTIAMSLVTGSLAHW